MSYGPRIEPADAAAEPACDSNNSIVNRTPAILGCSARYVEAFESDMTITASRHETINLTK